MTGDDRDLIITVVSIGAMAWVLSTDRVHQWRARRKYRRARRPRR